MTRGRFARPFAFLAIIECLALCAAFFAAAFAVAGPLLDAPLSALWRFVVVCLLVETMLFAVGLYSWHLATGYTDLMLRVFAGFTSGYGVYAALTYVFAMLRLPPDVLLLSFVIGVPLTVALRLAFLHLTNLAHLKSRVLVLGTGELAKRVADLAEQGRASRFVPVGFVQLESNDPAVPGDAIVDMPNDLAGYAHDQTADEIVVAMQDRRGSLPLEPLINARLSGIRVTDYQSFTERALGRIDLDSLKPSWFFQSEGFRSSRFDHLLKRLFDLLLSVVLLAFTAPLLLMTAIAIRLESPGPVFYRQERVGLGGKPFVLTKFRSMRADAEKDKPIWAQKSDPRVTRVGAFIRKTRIDEIPQVFNVLLGDMSFVGPRPERPFFVDLLARDIPFYRERHSVRPGITGWAQLNYPYGASMEDAKQKLQYDLFYIKYFSIIFDLSIVLQTVRVVIWSEGAR